MMMHHLLSRPVHLYNLYSSMVGLNLISLARSFPIMSSTAVMLHLVGTKRRLRATPIVPTENAFCISETAVPLLYAAITASVEHMSVS